MRRFALTMAALLVTVATGCEMEVPLRRPTKPPFKTEQSGGVESDDMKTSAGTDEPAAPRRFSRAGVSNEQMFRDPAGYNDSPIR